jgi:hypothetical protein
MDFLGWTKFVLVTHSMKTILRRHHARRCDHAGVRSLHRFPCDSKTSSQPILCVGSLQFHYSRGLTRSKFTI